MDFTFLLNSNGYRERHNALLTLSMLVYKKCIMDGGWWLVIVLFAFVCDPSSVIRVCTSRHSSLCCARLLYIFRYYFILLFCSDDKGQIFSMDFPLSFLLFFFHFAPEFDGMLQIDSKFNPGLLFAREIDFTR